MGHAAATALRAQTVNSQNPRIALFTVFTFVSPSIHDFHAKFFPLAYLGIFRISHLPSGNSLPSNQKSKIRNQKSPKSTFLSQPPATTVTTNSDRHPSNQKPEIQPPFPFKKPRNFHNFLKFPLSTFQEFPSLKSAVLHIYSLFPPVFCKLSRNRMHDRPQLTAPTLQRVIFHLDMDAFYASVEQRENLALKGKPVIVGSPPERRGVVCAASYEARKFGVRSAMPSATAGRLCPHGIFIPPRIDLYRQESQEVMRIVRDSGAIVEQVSIDEAYMELTHLLEPRGRTHDQLLEAAQSIGRAMKETIRRERLLTASIGIAANKFLAKLGSDLQKPDGLTLIRETGKAEFLRTLPVRKIHGVGTATEKILNSAGIFTIEDLQRYPGDLRAIVGSFSRSLANYALGIDERPLELGDEIKSISSEETFERDTMDRAQLRQCLWTQAADIAARLSRKRLLAQAVQVKIRYKNFQTLTRQITVEDPTQEARAIYRLGCFLLARDKLVQKPLRLLGLGVSGLTEGEPRQLKLQI